MPKSESSPAAALVTALAVAARMLHERWQMVAVDGAQRDLFASFARLDAQLPDADFASLIELAFRALATRIDVGRDLPYTLAAACAAIEPILMRRVASDAGPVDVALLVPCAKLDKAHWERVAQLAEYAAHAARVVAQRVKKAPADVRVRMVQLCGAVATAANTRAKQIKMSYGRAVHLGPNEPRIDLELWFVDELQFAPLDAAVCSPHRVLASLDERERARDRRRDDKRAAAAPNSLPVLRVTHDVVARWHAFAPGAVVRVERSVLDEGGTAFHYLRCE